ncbi:MAG: LacI family transcriptional regulator [Lachnospiraceae bacterium]|nr:LacI family transcriptional regulator [Lachnospiraceae bacterium]
MIRIKDIAERVGVSATTVSNVEEIIRQAKVWNLDGLIACNLQPGVIRHLHTLYQKPLVSLDAYLEDGGSYINIGIDDFGGGYEMGRYLAAMGHRRILMISDNDQKVDHERWLGLKKGLEEAGVPVSEGQHLIVSNIYRERLVQYKQYKELLRKQTALFFSSDLYALEACPILREMGFRIPEGLSLAGFDDLFCSGFMTPKLTTIRQDIEQKARMAVDALFSLMDGDEQREWVLPVELVKRGSVRRIEKREEVFV